MNNVRHPQQRQPGPNHHSHNHLEDEEDDDVAGGGAGGGGGVDGEESIDNPLPHSHSQIQYDANPHSHALHNGGATTTTTTMETTLNGVEGVGQHALYVPGSEIATAPPAGGGSDQLTLSFQGEVYVFDSVSPEKVQAVLLLLGGYEVPTGVPAVGGMPSQNHRSLGDFPGRSSQSQRAASLIRFREKRKERCFEKKIRYAVRKEVAVRMQRKKGQFTSSKSISDEVGSSSSGYNTMSGQEEKESLCTHCGTSSKSTPMMRRGPAGPRTLCNACGLKWANKGALKNLSKAGIQDPILRVSERSNGEANGSNAVTTNVDVITSSNGDNSGLTAER